MSTYVELKGGYLYVYVDEKWPPEVVPLVRACHRRTVQLFEFFREYGKTVEVGVVELPRRCAAAAAALAIMTYTAELDREVAYALCDDAPNAVKTLILDAVKWSRNDSGPLIDPRYYMKLAVAFNTIVDLWRSSKRL